MEKTELFMNNLKNAEAKIEQGLIKEGYDLLLSNVENSSACQESEFTARQFVKLAYCAFTNDDIKKTVPTTKKNDLESLGTYLPGIDAFKRCVPVIRDVNDGGGLFLRFEYTIVEAIVNELGCNFLKAADKYYFLSKNFKKIENKPMYTKFYSSLYFLSKAVACIIVTPPSPLRNSMIKKFLTDRFFTNLAVKDIQGILQKILDNTLILGDDITTLHQLIYPPEPSAGKKGSSASGGGAGPLYPFTNFFFPKTLVNFLGSALIQQNIVSISLLFDSIALKNLAETLRVKEREAMDGALLLLQSGELKGKIDQLNGTLVFHTESTLTNWNSRIEEACKHIGEVANQISNTK